MKDDKILITGGTGKTGRKVVEELNELGYSVRIGSRNADPSFDWNNKATWKAALDGMNMVYITYQPDLAVPGAVEIIEEFTSLAVEKGIQKLVLLSGKGEKEAERCEEIVKHSGTNWIIVRASWFNQNFSEGFLIDPIKAGVLTLPKGDELIPFVDTDDIASVIVETLTNDKYIGQTLELTGPRFLTFRDVAKEISEVTGREIEFKSVSIEEYSKMLKELQIPDDYIWLISYLFTEVLTRANSIITSDIEKVLGRKAKDFYEYAEETAVSGVWDSESNYAV